MHISLNITRDITLVLTSYARVDLLRKTIKSFLRFNTYPIADCIIIDDSGRPGINEWVKEMMPWPTTTIYTAVSRGQLQSIDIAYARVTTPYIFHCEDDWRFYKHGFIEESLRILESDPTVFTVWLRAHSDTNGHPIEYRGRGYHYMSVGYQGVWHGFTFNPGLRRTIDCMRLHPYASQPCIIEKGGGHRILGESDLSMHYHRLGYRAAITEDVEGYVEHIGRKRHIKLPWE